MSRRRRTMLSWKSMVERCQRAFTWWREMDVSGHDCGLATIEYRLRRFSRFGQSDRRSVTPEAIARTRKIVGFYSKHAVTADRFLDFPLPCSIMIANPFHPYRWWNDSFGNFSQKLYWYSCPDFCLLIRLYFTHFISEVKLEQLFE